MLGIFGAVQQAALGFGQYFGKCTVIWLDNWYARGQCFQHKQALRLLIRRRNREHVDRSEEIDLPPPIDFANVLERVTQTCVPQAGEDFVRVLSTVDALVLADVYPAGETPLLAADGRALARAVRVAGRVEPVFVENIDEMAAAIRALAHDGDVVVTMGAGSIGHVAGQLAA